MNDTEDSDIEDVTKIKRLKTMGDLKVFFEGVYKIHQETKMNMREIAQNDGRIGPVVIQNNIAIIKQMSVHNKKFKDIENLNILITDYCTDELNNSRIYISKTKRVQFSLNAQLIYLNKDLSFSNDTHNEKESGAKQSRTKPQILKSKNHNM